MTTKKKADIGEFIDAPVRFRRDEIHTFSPMLRFLMATFPGIQTVEDSLKPTGVPVYRQDISDAEPGNPAACAISIGAQRNCPGVTGAVINRTSAILIFNHSRAVRFSVPKTTYANLFAFDRGGTVEEGVYFLGAISESRRLIALQGRVMASNAQRGIPKNNKGQNRPGVKKKTLSHKKNILTPHPLFLRTWGNARIRSTFNQPTIVGATPAT